ncbi:MAG: RHS repeat-associated core domain-containing protein [Terracidiphilus sp.]
MVFGHGSAGNWPGQKPQNPPLPGGGAAIYNSSGLNFIRHTDWLGSSRLATTWAAHAVYSKEAYAPFGETYNEAGTADRSFTGQDQDVVTGSLGTGAYDFLFRKHDPSAGRWLSPDPYGWNAVDQTNPQTLNRYAYVMNSPLSLVDALGLCPGMYVTISSQTFITITDGTSTSSTSYTVSAPYSYDDGSLCVYQLQDNCVIRTNAEGNQFTGLICQATPNIVETFGSGSAGSAPNNPTPQPTKPAPPKLVWIPTCKDVAHAGKADAVVAAAAGALWKKYPITAPVTFPIFELFGTTSVLENSYALIGGCLY